VSLHAEALSALRGWPAPDEAQESLRRRYVAHLEQHPDGTYRGMAAGYSASCCRSSGTSPRLRASACFRPALTVCHFESASRVAVLENCRAAR
jgi:hypothetical protein